MPILSWSPVLWAPRVTPGHSCMQTANELLLAWTRTGIPSVTSEPKVEQNEKNVVVGLPAN